MSSHGLLKGRKEVGQEGPVMRRRWWKEEKELGPRCLGGMTWRRDPLTYPERSWREDMKVGLSEIRSRMDLS